MEQRCPFCEQLDKIIDDHKYYKENSKRSNIDKYEHKYMAALVSESYYDGSYTGEIRFGGFELNFCPVCGKGIKDGKCD